MTEEKPSWRIRVLTAAAEIEHNIWRKFPDALPARSPDGRGIPHALFMCQELQDLNGSIDSDTKACRWLGYLQGMMVYEGVSTLEIEKVRNLRSGD